MRHAISRPCCLPLALQMGSIMYWRFPSQSTLLTVVLIGFNVVTAATFVFTMVYVARTQVLSKTKLAGTVLARFTVRVVDML